MGGGDLNTKKSWHPSTLKNQERVWAAERAAEQERSRIVELQRERSGERERDELRALGRRAGTLPESGDGGDKLSWMYNQPNKSGNTEDYLLGKAIDNNYERLVAEEKQNDKTAAPSKNHVEHEVIPFSIRNLRGGAAAALDGQVDMARKLQEDPLAAIRRRELEARAQLLQNPLRLQQLTNLLRQEQTKRKEKKAKKKLKKHKSELDQLLAQKLTSLQGKQIDIASLLSADKKKKKKKKSSHSDSDSSASSSEDERAKKKKNKRKHSDSQIEEKLQKKKKPHETVSDNERSTKKKKQRASTENVESSSSKKKTRNSPESVKKHLPKKKKQDSSEREDIISPMAKKRHSPDREHKYSSKNKQQHFHIDHEQKSPKKKRKEVYSDREERPSRNKDRKDSEEKSFGKKKRNDSYADEVHAKKKSKRKDRSPTPKKSKSARDRSDSPEVTSRKRDIQEKRRSRSEGTPPDFERHREALSRRTRDSSGDSDTDRRRTNYGLVAADGRKLKTSKRTEEAARAHAAVAKPKEEVWRRPAVERLSEAEKERRRREMVEAAAVRDVERERSVARHREAARREEAAAAGATFDAQFATRQAARAAGGSVQQRIRSNVYNIQRSDRHMDVNFAKR